MHWSTVTIESGYSMPTAGRAGEVARPEFGAVATPAAGDRVHRLCKQGVAGRGAAQCEHLRPRRLDERSAGPRRALLPLPCQYMVGLVLPLGRGPPRRIAQRRLRTRLG